MKKSWVSWIAVEIEDPFFKTRMSGKVKEYEFTCIVNDIFGCKPFTLFKEGQQTSVIQITFPVLYLNIISIHGLYFYCKEKISEKTITKSEEILVNK